MFSNMLFAVASETTSLTNISSSGSILALIAGFVILTIIVSIVLYIYMALALQSIGKKLKYKHPWLAWIPIANYAMLLELGNFHWALIFLALIPILGWIALGILFLIALWRIFEKRKYPGYLTLVLLLSPIPFLGIIAGIAFFVLFGIVAWKDR